MVRKLSLLSEQRVFYDSDNIVALFIINSLIQFYLYWKHVIHVMHSLELVFRLQCFDIRVQCRVDCDWQCGREIHAKPKQFNWIQLLWLAVQFHSFISIASNLNTSRFMVTHFTRIKSESRKFINGPTTSIHFAIPVLLTKTKHLHSKVSINFAKISFSLLFALNISGCVEFCMFFILFDNKINKFFSQINILIVIQTQKTFICLSSVFWYMFYIEMKCTQFMFCINNEFQLI